MAKSEYTWVNNRKRGSVGMHSGKTLVRFEPGTHKYPTKLLAGINLSRKANSAYWEGDDPVLSEVRAPTNHTPDVPTDVNAKEMVALIKTMADLDALEKIAAEDTRSTVVSAANKRIEDLKAGGEPTDPPDGDNSGDGDPQE